MPSPSPSDRVFILSPSVRRAREWCRENDIPPHAKRVVIITTVEATRGHEFRPGDRAVDLGAAGPVRREWRRVQEWSRSAR